MEYFQDTWAVLDSYFRTNPYFLTKHHLDSFNDFVSHRILKTIQALNPILVIKNQVNVTHEIEVYVGGALSNEIFITKPTIVQDDKQRLMYPNEARLKDFTYQSEIYANVLIKYTTKEGNNATIEEKRFEGVKIGAIPIMLHSKLCMLHDMKPEVRREMGECKWDCGGYFIVDGKEKVIVAQERIATNRIFITKSSDPKYEYTALIRCTSDDTPLFPKVVNFYVNGVPSKPPTTAKPDDDENDVENAAKPKKTNRIHESIDVTIPYCAKPIPLFVLFRALGIESDMDILKHICDIYDDKEYVEFMRPSIVHASNVCGGTQEDAIAYISNFVEYKNATSVKKILTNDLFPNIGTVYRHKAVFLGYLVGKIIKVCLGVEMKTDRDSYVYKRVDISGFLLGNIFRDYYNQFRNVIRNNLDNQYLYGPWRNTKNVHNLVNVGNMNFIFNAEIIEGGMKKSLKGMWGKSMVAGGSEHVRQGLVQDLSRISYLGFISHLRRVNTPIDPTSKVVAPHHLHSTQWGIMCPCESPDGGSIGLLKNFAIMCHITFDKPYKDVLTHVLGIKGFLGLDDLQIDMCHDKVKIFINSNLVGYTEDPYILFNTLKLLKLNGIIDIFTSISWHVIPKEIHILTEAGRCCRPVYVIRQGKLLIADYIKDVKAGRKGWHDLIQGTHKRATKTYDIAELEKTMAPIEFLDVEETAGSLIAMDPNHLDDKKPYTHCEIHPSTILSVLTLNIPLCQHNQAPRNIFSGAQGKQAIGIYATNFNDRIDTMSYVLHYPQRSLVNTRYMEYMHNNDMPHGENLIVAIATYTGYNQEDSIIINKNSIQRGCFNLTYFKNMIEKEEIDNDTHIVFRNTADMVTKDHLEVTGIRQGNYKKIDANGFPVVNEYIAENDVIFGKCCITYQEQEQQNNIFENKVKVESYQDKSVMADKTVSGIIDKVFIFYDEQDQRTCKVRFRKIRQPELGDKLCSRTAQKGVIGMVLPQEAMPFNKDGIVPDIIINPHAFPTRMTIGHLLECLVAKTAVNIGSCIDGTPFNNNQYEGCCAALESFGMEKYCNEVLYCGFTGNQIDCDIFFGPTYYERLKHMVADKINYRSVGPVTNKTRQPTKGRGNGGGLRIGEMERDSVLAHGACSFLKESLMERSDIYEFFVDKKTGFIADKESASTVRVKAPCAFRLMLQEVAAMGVKAQLEFTSTSTCDDDINGFDAEVEYELSNENLNKEFKEDIVDDTYNAL